MDTASIPTDTAPIAPPIPNDTSFYCRFFEGISGIRDRAGRPLHEVDFRNELNTSDARQCPYGGSRRGYLINQAALGTVVRDWPKIKAGLNTLIRTVRLEPYHRDAGLVVWARSLVPMFLPLYVLRKARVSHLSATLPTDVSGLFKVMLDVPTTIDLMLARGWAAPCRVGDHSYSAMGIAEFAETSGIFNNGEWTCAGPPRLIEELLEVLWSSYRNVDRGISSIDTLVSDHDFESYILLMIKQYALSQAFQVCTAYLMEQAFLKLGNYDGRRTPVAAEMRLPAYELRRRILLNTCRDRTSAIRVISGFCDVAAKQDGSQNTTQAKLESAMILAIGNSQTCDSVQLLDAQIAIQTEFAHVIASLQSAARDSAGTLDGGEMCVDLSCFDRDDFPTVILQKLLRTW